MFISPIYARVARTKSRSCGLQLYRGIFLSHTAGKLLDNRDFACKNDEIVFLVASELSP